TYNTWRGISTVKARTGPTKQNEDAQIALRALTALATAAWQALTDAQRSLWNHYADTHPDPDWTGNPQRLTGYNWFIRINVRRQLIDQGIEAAPPEDPCLLRLYALWGEYYPPMITFTWTAVPEPPADQYYVEIYHVGPHSAGA
ncbi:unnamed protein product, partial [marine sediment metagenome]